MFDFNKTVIEYPLLEKVKFERYFILTLLFIGSSLIFLDKYYFESDLLDLLICLEIERSIHMTMVTVSAVVLTFFIPHTMDMVLRISERYQSEVVVDPYFSRWENFCFPIILIVHIVISGLLLFLENYNDNVFWETGSWLALVIFLYIVPKVGDYYYKTSVFVKSTDHILEEHFERAEQILE